MVAHMDSDGGEEPAVTTDVMLSGTGVTQTLTIAPWNMTEPFSFW